MKRASALVAGLLGLLSTTIPARPAAAQASAPPAAETKAQRDARMRWWTDARFGMFIHWGIYAVPARGEWYMNEARMPREEYARYGQQFDPVKFDADRWAQIAHDAGQKYLVITSKHHDGFSMFNSGATDYSVVKATSWRTDPLKALSDACRRHGVRFCVYYSIMDWHSPDQVPAHPDPQHPEYNPTSFGPGRKDAYVRYMKTQLKELITQYHPGLLWFDGGWMNGWTGADGEDLYRYLHSLDPKLIINDRIGGGGDYGTPEQNIPATGLRRPWETCMTINNNWGYNAGDHDFKTSRGLLRNLIDIASKGGNYLLNVGPDATGVIPAPEVERLAEMGAWLKANGHSIYGTTASPFKRLPFDGRATVHGSTLYLNVFTWPDASLTLSGLQTPVKDARALATGQKLTVTKAADGTLTISRPSKIDADSTAIALRLAGPPVVAASEDAIAPQSDGSYSLLAADATLEGDTFQLSGTGATADIGYWIDAADKARWDVTVPAAQSGPYRATLDYACEPGSVGATFAVQVDGASSGVTGTVTKTAGWDDYHTMTLDGTLRLTAGPHVLRVVPLTKPGYAVMNLRRLVLTPTTADNR